jgi:hypothetical protein
VVVIDVRVIVRPVAADEDRRARSSGSTTSATSRMLDAFLTRPAVVRGLEIPRRP